MRSSWDPECYLARNCTLLGDITIGKHSSVYPGVVIRAEREPIVIGTNTNHPRQLRNTC